MLDSDHQMKTQHKTKVFAIYSSQLLIQLIRQSQWLERKLMEDKLELITPKKRRVEAKVDMAEEVTVEDMAEAQEEATEVADMVEEAEAEEAEEVI